MKARLVSFCSILLIGLAAPSAVDAAKPLTTEQKQGVLASLARAQAAARAGEPLPFKLSCKEEAESGACSGGGRDALASLPLDRAVSILRRYTKDCAAPRPPCLLGERAAGYEIVFPHAAGDGASWTVHIDMEAEPKEIGLYRSFITFH